MSNELYQSAIRMLTERFQWEAQARLFYRMRHGGLPRVNKPFPGCADGHFPEIDMAIRRLKPFWIGQVTAGDKLCAFTALRQQLSTVSDAAGDYFDFLLMQRTEFMRKLRVAVDMMLLYGRGIIKSTVDPLDDYKLVFEAVNPMFVIMPQEAMGFEDADEFIHGRPFTVASYERLDDRWAKDPSTINRIRGNKDFQSIGLYNQEVRLREGIAYTRQPNGILIFEHYTKTGGGWTVNTYSPNAPEISLRKSYGVPFKINGKTSQPFFSFQMEVKDEGWYSPRGVGELLAPIEQYLTKVWNEKADSMTFVNRPVLTGSKEITNSANYRWQPGEYINGDIRSVQMAPPAISFDQEIQFARAIGEQQAQSPDFGITNAQGQGDAKGRTATENNRISALQSAGSNDNASMFREDLSKLYRHVWGLICQFKKRDFSYFVVDEIKTLQQEALHDQYLVTPDGSPDGWNRLARFQKAVTAMGTFNGNPNSNPEYWTKEAMAAYDSRAIVKGGFVPTGLQGASEYEDEVIEINALMAPSPGRPSFPAPVFPAEDHATRIKACLDWIAACGQMQTPVDPIAQQRIHQHIAQHLQALQQQDPKKAGMVKQMIAQAEKPQGQQAGGQPQQPGQPQPAGNPPQPSGNNASASSGPTKESISINYKDAPPDIQRQMEKAAGFQPSVVGVEPQANPKTP